MFPDYNRLASDYSVFYDNALSKCITEVSTVHSKIVGDLTWKDHKLVSFCPTFRLIFLILNFSTSRSFQLHAYLSNYIHTLLTTCIAFQLQVYVTNCIVTY